MNKEEKKIREQNTESYNKINVQIIRKSLNRYKSWENKFKGKKIKIIDWKWLGRKNKKEWLKQ